MNLKDEDVEMRWDLHTFVKSFVHDRGSEDEVGLQMADLMAGETRVFSMLTLSRWSSQRRAN